MIRNLIKLTLIILVLTYLVDLFNLFKNRSPRIISGMALILNGNYPIDSSFIYDMNLSRDSIIYFKSFGKLDDSVYVKCIDAIKRIYFVNNFLFIDSIEDNRIIKEDSLNGDLFLDFYNKGNVKTIYITDRIIKTKEGPALGYTKYESKCIIMNSKIDAPHVVVHELGHTYGLDHCKNKNCVMFYMYINNGHDLCEKCKNKLKYRFSEYEKT
jgi:hypothetical protein